MNTTGSPETVRILDSITFPEAELAVGQAFDELEANIDTDEAVALIEDGHPAIAHITNAIHLRLERDEYDEGRMADWDDSATVALRAATLWLKSNSGEMPAPAQPLEALQAITPAAVNAAVGDIVPALANLRDEADLEQHVTDAMHPATELFPAIMDDLPAEVKRQFIEQGKHPDNAEIIAFGARFGAWLVIQAAKRQAAQASAPAPESADPHPELSEPTV